MQSAAIKSRKVLFSSHSMQSPFYPTSPARLVGQGGHAAPPASAKRSNQKATLVATHYNLAPNPLYTATKPTMLRSWSAKALPAAETTVGTGKDRLGLARPRDTTVLYSTEH